MKLSIVIPVHNEEGNISDLVKEIDNVPFEHEYEIIVVNDFSTDSTKDVLGKLMKEVKTLRVIEHHSNYGQSAGVYTGIKNSLGDVIATLDGDGQNDPNDIPKLLVTLLSNKNLSMVAGFRKKRNDNAWRIFSSKVANFVRSSLLKDDTPDSGCGLKVFYREAFLQLPFFNHMHRFLPALFKIKGFEIQSVEVNHRQREHGKSNYGTWDRLKAGIFDLFGVYWLRARNMNIKFTELK